MSGAAEFEARGYKGIAGEAVSKASQFFPSAQVETAARRMLIYAAVHIGMRCGLTLHDLYQEIGALLEEWEE